MINENIDLKIGQLAVPESGIWELPKDSIELAPEVRQALLPNTLYFKYIFLNLATNR